MDNKWSGISHPDHLWLLQLCHNRFSDCSQHWLRNLDVLPVDGSIIIGFEIEKGFEESSRMGHPKKRYTSINLLSELKIDEDIETIPQQYKEELQKIIFNNRPIDEKIINNSYDTIPTNTDFIQYFDTMNILSTRFEDITNIEDKIKYLEDIVNNATKNIKIYNEKHTLGQLTSKHLEDYKNAINSFKNDNFI